MDRKQYEVMQCRQTFKIKGGLTARVVCTGELFGSGSTGSLSVTCGGDKLGSGAVGSYGSSSGRSGDFSSAAGRLYCSAATGGDIFTRGAVVGS